MDQKHDSEMPLSLSYKPLSPQKIPNFIWVELDMKMEGE